MKKTYKYNILKAGSIQPKNWIKNQLSRDLRQGYIGHFDNIHNTVTHDVFVQKDRKSKRNINLRKEWWKGEHEAYWKDAIIRTAFLTGDEIYTEISHHWINNIIESSDESGYIGIYKNGEAQNTRFRHRGSNGELWVTSRILMALLAYHEFTGKQNVLTATEKATKLIINQYRQRNYFSKKSIDGGISHGIGFFEVLEWLYRITGDQEYLDFAIKLYKDFNQGKARDDDLQTINLSDENRLFRRHGAHIAEGIFVPQFMASIKNTKLLNYAATNTLKKLRQHFTPGGAMRCDEFIKGRAGTADERYEYCGIAELINPLLTIISMSGNISLADHIEKMTYNAGQGARFNDLSALSYLTSDNRIKINHHEIVGREHYDAAHRAAVCCVLNGGRLMPYFVNGMWMKKANSNNLIALLYGPCELETEINNMPVKIIENTSYPFSDNIEFTIQCGSVIKFPITFRKPFKCKNVVVDVSRNARIEENDEQLTIHHTWKDGDKINIRFNFIVHKKLQPKSKTVKNKGIYLQRGPLVYALPFETKKKKTKEHKSSGFYRYKVKAINKNGWQSRMNINDYFEFRPLKINQTDFPWDNPVVSLKGPLIDKNGNKTNVDLVPMGNTIFRRVTFSRYENNKKNIEQ